MPKTPSDVPHPEKDERIVYLFTYLLLWISGLLVFLTEAKKNKRIKYHAVQATILGVIVFVLVIAPLPLVPLLGFLLWIYGMYVAFMAYEGRDISMPVIGQYAEQYSK
ncbi:MAG: hypothetical protein KGH94_05420 [Candidatus Micrarchaeota archaeon]|nr:hypothetical protein [Candidatus Micrarchaeota archaeon]